MKYYLFASWAKSISVIISLCILFFHQVGHCDIQLESFIAASAHLEKLSNRSQIEGNDSDIESLLNDLDPFLPFMILDMQIISENRDPEEIFGKMASLVRGKIISILENVNRAKAPHEDEYNWEARNTLIRILAEYGGIGTPDFDNSMLSSRLKAWVYLLAERGLKKESIAPSILTSLVLDLNKLNLRIPNTVKQNYDIDLRILLKDGRIEWLKPAILFLTLPTPEDGTIDEWGKPVAEQIPSFLINNHQAGKAESLLKNWLSEISDPSVKVEILKCLVLIKSDKPFALAQFVYDQAQGSSEQMIEILRMSNVNTEYNKHSIVWHLFLLENSTEYYVIKRVVDAIFLFYRHGLNSVPDMMQGHEQGKTLGQILGEAVLRVNKSDFKARAGRLLTENINPESDNEIIRSALEHMTDEPSLIEEISSSLDSISTCNSTLLKKVPSTF